MGIDILKLPILSYFFEWHNVSGTYIFGFLGLAVCVVACVVTWQQIICDKSVNGKTY